VLGENEWIFFPPNHTKYFSKKINILDDEKYERFEGISKNGDIIFIPPLWYIFFSFEKRWSKVTNLSPITIGLVCEFKN
jgi:hypothetical protein